MKCGSELFSDRIFLWLQLKFRPDASGPNPYSLVKDLHRAASGPSPSEILGYNFHCEMANHFPEAYPG